MSDHGQMRGDEQHSGVGSDTDERLNIACSGADDALADLPPSGPTRRHHQRRVTSFRSRRSSISDSQLQTWDKLWPVYGRVARDDDGTCLPLDTSAWFGRQAPLILEIGCGTGTSTTTMALSEPEKDVLAVEVYRKGLSQLLCAIEREQIQNIRLVRGDGLDVLEFLLPSASLTAVRVFFPDPWPKARHNKRRLIQPATVALISDRLRPGGVLHVATDHADYAEHIATVGEAEPTLERLDLDAPQIPVSVIRPTTKFEGKGLAAGSSINEFVWRRRCMA